MSGIPLSMLPKRPGQTQVRLPQAPWNLFRQFFQQKGITPKQFLIEHRSRNVETLWHDLLVKFAKSRNAFHFSSDYQGDANDMFAYLNNIFTYFIKEVGKKSLTGSLSKLEIPWHLPVAHVPHVGPVDLRRGKPLPKAAAKRAVSFAEAAKIADAKKKKDRAAKKRKAEMEKKRKIRRILEAELEAELLMGTPGRVEPQTPATVPLPMELQPPENKRKYEQKIVYFPDGKGGTVAVYENDDF